MNSLVAEKKKFTQYQVLLWVGIGSILMAFAGLTKKNLPRGNWRMLTEQEIINLKNV